MAYSFIQTAPKSPLSPAVRKVWYAGLLLVFLLAGSAAGLRFYSAKQQAAIANSREVQRGLQIQLEQLQHQQISFKSEKLLRERVYTGNQLIVDRIADLLDLIPDDTVLQRFESDGATLLYSGKCADFKALKRELSRAFSGQYRMVKSHGVPDNALTAFTLRFATPGEQQ
jgi:hypothetical protein